MGKDLSAIGRQKRIVEDEEKERSNRQTRYFNELLKLACAPELVLFFRNIPAKELTESFGAFQAVADTIGWERLRNPDRDVVCLVPGDGVQPRTAALFAYRTRRWKIWSIDPVMRSPPPEADPVRNLHTVKGEIEEFDAIDCRGKIGVVVAVHGHFWLDDAAAKLKDAAEVIVVAIPCCYNHFLTDPDTGERRPPNRVYRDLGIWSHENDVFVWHWKNPPIITDEQTNAAGEEYQQA